MQPNYMEVYSPLSTADLLSLTSGGRKNKRTELDDKRLTLCHAKFGGIKALAVPHAKMLRGTCPPRIMLPWWLRS